jgi:hypothetical protein
MARLYLRRTMSGFEPADEPSRESWKKFKVGEIYRGDVVKPRSYQHHKQIMALLNLTSEKLLRWQRDIRKKLSEWMARSTAFPPPSAMTG